MPQLILEFAVRAALVALGTAGVLRMLRVKSAGARHAAWTGVLVLMLLLPAWTAWGPRASVRLLPATAVPAASTTMALTVPMLPAASEGVAPAASAQSHEWNWRTALAIVYLVGALVLLMRLALGTVRSRALVHGAVHREGHWTSSSCTTPITVGLLRPTVILPECWRSWPPAQLNAVLTHESEHARRHDPLAQWLALLNRAIFWFHPLAWWLERRLSALAEEACDAAVLQRGHDPYDYSEYLMELARAVGRNGMRVNVVGMAMPGSSLPQRIRQIVGQGPAPRMTHARTLCLAAACVTISALFAAATVDRQQLPPEPPAPPAAPAPPSAMDAPTPLPAVPPAPPSFAPVADPSPVPMPPPAPAPLADPAPLLPPPPPPAPLAAPAPLPPSPPLPPQERRQIALFFDWQGMSADMQSRLINFGTAFVQRQMRPGDVAAVMSSNGRDVRVRQDFTGDRELLTRAIGQLTGDSRGTLEANGQLDSLRAAVEILGHISGKKSLVYFVIPNHRVDEGQRQTVVNAAVGANVAFFPIDARGVSEQ